MTRTEAARAGKSSARPSLLAALGLSVALLGLRLNTAEGLGFGDAEALYACYALYPAEAYLDHPGLVGTLLRSLGGGSAPSAETAHSASAVLATLVPWLAALAARATGVPWERAARVVLGLALVPELAVGLFGVSPDLPLAVCWLSALALGSYLCQHQKTHPHSLRVLGAWLGLGLALGLGVLAKLTMLLLGLAFVVASFGPRLRFMWKGYGPWCALACALILMAPLMTWEVNQGFPMLQHRLVTTQTAAGVSLTNFGKFVGGQLVYVTPPFLLAAYWVARDLYLRRRDDGASSVLWWSFLIPLLALAPLCLWSARAEPHWVAPALLALGVHSGRGVALSRRLTRSCLATGAAVVLLVWLSVKTEAYIWLGKSPIGEMFGGYRARYDLTNDLYAWGPGRRLVSDAASAVTRSTGKAPALIGTPHWMVCAQAQLALAGRLRVGCYSALPSDFDRWFPRSQWLGAHSLLVVEDSRFPVDLAREFPDRQAFGSWRSDVRRGAHVVRTLRVTELRQRLGTASLGTASREPL